MLNPDPVRGFTLIELLIAITMIGVLLALGAPPLSAYLQNSKIGNTASNVAAGLQMARTEAIRRNMPVEFVLTSSALGASSIATSLTPNAAGPNWVVRASGPTFTLIEARAGVEGAGNPGAPGVQLAASGPAALEFNSFGGTAAGTGFAVDVSNPGGGACASASGPMRCRRVVVSAGGKVVTCDPVALAGDSRACP